MISKVFSGLSTIQTILLNIVAMRELTRPLTYISPLFLLKNLHPAGVPFRTFIKPVGTFHIAKIIGGSFIFPDRRRISFFNFLLTNRIKRHLHLWKFNFMLAKRVSSSALLVILRRDPAKLPNICLNNPVQLFSPPGPFIRFIGHVVCLFAGI